MDVSKSAVGLQKKIKHSSQIEGVEEEPITINLPLAKIQHQSQRMVTVNADVMEQYSRLQAQV